MRRALLGLLVWACVIPLVPALRSQESQPSLGDLARKERERKSQQQGAGSQEKKVWTTDDMKGGRASSTAQASEAHFEALEANVKRPGMDYRDFELSESRPELCQGECASDARCRSFTFAKPGVEGPKAHCWLKFGIPSSVRDECCTSAVKVAGFKPLEYDTDRPGKEYRNFDLAEARPEACQDECARDGACKAFTYVRPGYQGAKARCSLKSAVADSKSDLCCVSGVKGAETVNTPAPSQDGSHSAPKK